MGQGDDPEAEDELLAKTARGLRGRKASGVRLTLFFREARSRDGLHVCDRCILIFFFSIAGDLH